jgi:hypothetical protein
MRCLQEKNRKSPIVNNQPSKTPDGLKSAVVHVFRDYKDENSQI